MKRSINRIPLLFIFCSILIPGGLPCLAGTENQPAEAYYRQATEMRKAEKDKTGFPHCETKCRELYEKSAELGFAKAQYLASINLAAENTRNAKYGFYESQLELEKARQKANGWLLDAAKQGDNDSIYLLGLVQLQLCDIHKGYQIDYNPGQGKEKLFEAANSGNSTAQFLLSIAFYYGTAENYTREKVGDAFLSQYPEGLDVMDGDSHLLYSKKSAISIEDVSLLIQPFKLDIQKLFGGINVERDRQKALHWLTKAAENDLIIAQYELGRLFLLGHLVPRDGEKAFYWFKRVVDSKKSIGRHSEYFCRSAYRLAESYRQGKGVRPDRFLAKQYYLEMNDSYKIDISYAGKVKFTFGRFLQSQWDDPDHQKMAKFLIFQGAIYRHPAAMQWTEEKARKGDPMAQMVMAELARGTSALDLDVYGLNLYKTTRFENAVPDYPKAFQWYQRSAGNGYAPAQVELASMYETGTGVSQNLEEAETWYRKAAEQNYRVACYKLGMLLLREKEPEFVEQIGFGEKPNAYMQRKQQAVEYFRIAAQEGETESFSRGSWLFGCQDESRKNIAERILNPCSERHPHLQSLYQLARIYEEGKYLKKNLPKSHKLAEKAANLGDVKSYGTLAYNYYFGRGTAKDYNKAYFWATKEEVMPDPLSRLVLGWMYQKGHGVKKDDKTALKYFFESASRQNARAYYEIGIAFLKGLGTKRDDVMAARALIKAAELGDGDAPGFIRYAFDLENIKNKQHIDRWIIPCAKANITIAEFTLAELFDRGQILDQDYKQAYQWYVKAAEKNHPEAMQKLASYYEFGKSVPVDMHRALTWHEKSLPFIRRWDKQLIQRRIDYLKFYYQSEANGVQTDDAFALPGKGEPELDIVSQIVGSEIKKIVFSPSGEYFVTIGKGDHQILIWDFQSGQIVKRLYGHTAEVNDVVISKNQRYLVSAGDDKKIIIRDFYSGKPISVLGGHCAAINDLELSPSNHYLVSASSDTHVGIWKFPSGESYKMIKGGQTAIHSVAVSPDERYLLTGSRLELANLRTFPEGKILYVDPQQRHPPCKSFYQRALFWRDKPEEINFIQGYKEDGEYQKIDTYIKCWSINVSDHPEKRECFSKFRSSGWYKSRYTDALVLGRLGRYFVYNDDNPGLAIIDAISGETLHRIPFDKDRGKITALGMDPKEEIVLAAYKDGSFQSFGLGSGKRLREFQPVMNRIERISFRKDNQGLVIQNQKGDLREWPIIALHDERSPATPACTPLHYEFEHKKILLACQNSLGDCTDSLTGLAARLKRQRKSAEDAETAKIFIDPKTKSAFFYGTDGSLEVAQLDRPTGRTRMIRTIGDEALDLVYANGAIYTLNSNGTVFKWDLEYGTPITGWQTHNRTLGAMAADRAGYFLLTGGKLSLKCWDLNQSDLKTRIPLNEWKQINNVREIVISSDDRFASVLSGYHRLFLLDLTAGFIMNRIHVNPKIKSFAISPDGKTLAVATADSSVWIFDLLSGERLARRLIGPDCLKQIVSQPVEKPERSPRLALASQNLKVSTLPEYLNPKALRRAGDNRLDSEGSFYAVSNPCLSFQERTRFPLVSIGKANFASAFSKIEDYRAIDSIINKLERCKQTVDRSIHHFQFQLQAVEKQVQSCKPEACDLGEFQQSLRALRRQIAEESAKTVFYKVIHLPGNDSLVEEIKTGVLALLKNMAPTPPDHFTALIPSSVQVIPFVNAGSDLNAFVLVAFSAQTKPTR